MHSIALVGMPGGGKSTVGRQLSKRLDWQFWDSDAVIEKRVGSAIRTFFTRAGEAAFRELEATVMDELTAVPHAVIATGGGAILNADSRVRLHDRCKVVYLHSSPEELWRRLRHDTSRPLLQVADPLGRLRELYVQRDPLYREIAHFVVETGRPSVSALVNILLMQLELAGEIAQGSSSHPPSTPPEQV